MAKNVFNFVVGTSNSSRATLASMKKTRKFWKLWLHIFICLLFLLWNDPNDFYRPLVVLRKTIDCSGSNFSVRDLSICFAHWVTIFLKLIWVMTIDCSAWSLKFSVCQTDEVNAFLQGMLWQFTLSVDRTPDLLMG